MGLFEVLITNMMLICGANNNSSIKYLLAHHSRGKSLETGIFGWVRPYNKNDERVLNAQAVIWATNEQHICNQHLK